MKTESLEQFLARGGKIQKLPPAGEEAEKVREKEKRGRRPRAAGIDEPPPLDDDQAGSLAPILEDDE